MNDVVRGVTVFGRQFKPVAFGVMLMMIGLMVASALRLGAYDDNAFGAHLELITAGISAALLALGWWRNNIRFTEWGLLAGVFAYLTRFLFLVFQDLTGDSVLLALGTLVIIAGSYVLEVQDRE